jgi:microcin C transport system substrate-binding protein
MPMTGLALARGVAAAWIVLSISTLPGLAQEWRTSSSLLGESRYGQDFRRYDHVNPDAPKGGALNSVATGTFDSFNPYIVRGTPAAGFAPFGGGLLYDTLMEQSIDEPNISHGLVAEAYQRPDDFSSVTFRLDSRARWHDGQPITVEDVIWSFQALKANSPMYSRYYDNVTEAVALDDHTVEFRFDQKGNRELPQILGDLVVLPKHWWEGTDASGRKRDITQPTLEPPLGSAAYRIKSFKPGAEIVWERVDDYWGRSLPVKVGRENFDTRRYLYFQDDNAQWQAFTKGGYQDIRLENRAQKWATEYKFPAFQAGDVLKAAYPTESGEPMQGFVLNTRRPQFQDRRVREALNWAFDFESMNRTLFYGLYARTGSYFEGGELASSGLPQGRELEILEEYRDKLPPELFTQEFKLPVYDTPKAARDNLRRAFDLLKEAGWVNKDGRLVDGKTGEPFRIEFLGSDPSDERIAGPFMENLRKLGIEATLRVVDTSQYISRFQNFDFDVVTAVLAQSQSPGNEQRDFWSSRAADTPGSRNLSGIRDPVVDALVERVIFATDREDLVAATRALDRVLLWGRYIVPQWHNPELWIAYWNKFGIPPTQPAYVGVDTESWWIDPQKEKALAARYRSVN